MIKIILLSLLLTGCSYMPVHEKGQAMSGEEQYLRLVKCTSLGLDYMVITNVNQQVVDITCRPRVGHKYELPSSIPEVKEIKE